MSKENWNNIKYIKPKPLETVYLKFSDGSVMGGYIAENETDFYHYDDDSIVTKEVVAWSIVEEDVRSRFQDKDLFSEIEKFNVSESQYW